MKRAVLLLVVAAGCVPATGTILEVQGPMDTTSIAAGVATLELVVAHTSWCDRWVQDASASRTRVSVAGRDLDKRPYDFLVEPSHQTDLSQPAYLAVLAYSSSGQLLGEATFGMHPFAKDQVFKRQARIQLFAPPVSMSGGPQYVASDGCVCVPGEPWLGTATGQGCDTRVITSFDRLGDTAGCELTPKGAPLPVPVCDGQQYMDEPKDRDLPCWAADSAGVCRMKTRRCADHDGVAWAEECVTDGNDTGVPQNAALCAQYLGCEQTACGDVTGCFVASFTQPLRATCTLRIDPSTPQGQPLQPCPGSPWKTTFPAINGPNCVAAILQGVDQPPFTLGLTVAGQTAAQPVSTACPAGVQVDAIDAPSLAAVPKGRVVDFVYGTRLVHATINVVLQCNGNEASLVCHLMP